MRSGGVARFLLGVLISLSFWPSILVSQTVELSPTRPLAEASVRHGPPASGITRSVLGNLPLQFEENQGQADRRARFLARGPGYTLFLNSDGLALNLQHKANSPGQWVSMHLLGAQAAEILGRERTATQTNYYLGKDPRDWHLDVPSYHEVAYSGVYDGIDLIYHGNGSQLEYDFVVAPEADPAQIRMTFDGLVPSLRDGDLSFTGTRGLSIGGLKAYQVIHGVRKPVGASWLLSKNQASIQIGPYDHREQLVIDPVFFYGSYIGGGSSDAAVSIVPASKPGFFYVALSTTSPNITEPTSESTQNPNTTGTDTLILGLDTTGSNGPPSAFPPYNQTAETGPTVVVGSVTYLGGTTGITVPTGMVADSHSNLYITGTTTNGADFPQLGSQVCSQACNGYTAKFSTSIAGSPATATLTPQYSFGLPAEPTAIAVDTSGNSYLTGSASTDSGSQKLTIPSKDSAFQAENALGTALNSGTHAFLLELGSDGTTAFASYIGGSGSDKANAIALSGSTVYITGQTTSTNFPTAEGAYQTAYGGDPDDAFVFAATNLSTSPARVFSTYLGGSNNDIAYSIGLAPSGNVVVAGSTDSSQNCPLQPSKCPAVWTPFPVEGSPEFIALKLPATGTAEGSGGELLSIGVPPSKPAAQVPLPTAVPDGSQDAFVTSLSGDGTQLVFTDFLGGDGLSATSTSAQALAVDNIGAIYVTGWSSATDYIDSKGGLVQPFLNGNAIEDIRSGSPVDINGYSQVGGNYSSIRNIFFGQLDPSGKYLLEATLAGGTGTDQPNGITLSEFVPPAGSGAALKTAGIVSIVGWTTPAGGTNTDQGNDPTLFASAAESTLENINPTGPAKSVVDDKTGFLVQEGIAGYCDMKLMNQSGPSLTFTGHCITGTQMGFALVSYTGSNVASPPDCGSNVANPWVCPFQITVQSGALTGTVNVDTSGLVGKTNVTISFAFEPYGAIPGTGNCTANDQGLSGCSIQTTGGGAGTLFNVTPGALSVALSCSVLGTPCDAHNTVLVGQPVTLNAIVTNGVPNTVKWSLSGGTGTFGSDPSTPSTSIVFTPGGIGGQVVVKATPVVDLSVSNTINLNTLAPTIVSFASSGPFAYGQTNITVNVTSSANAASPTGDVKYQVKEVNAPSITGTSHLINGSASIPLPKLGAGSYSITVSYPGDSANFLANSSNSLNFTVNQAPLTVTATSPPPIIYGQPIPALTYTITGFVNGDTNSVITGTAVLTTTATSTSQPGDYPITFSTKTLAATNYSFNYVDGTLTITPVGAAPPPIISPAGGSYTSTQTATISDSLAGAKLYYTTDGTEPTTASTLYAGPIAINASVTIRAIAVASGYKNSATSNATFNLSAPTLSATSISFGNIVQGTLSDTETIVFSNSGVNSLGALTLKLGGADPSEFALSSGTTCGASVAANSSCSVAVTFTPASLGARSATLAISYAGIGSPETVNLGGVGVSPLSIISSVTELVAGTTFEFTSSAPAVWTASAGTMSSSGFFTAPNPPPTPAQVTVTATSTVNPQIFVTTQVTIVPVPAIIVPTTNTLPAGGSITIPISITAGTGIAGESMTLACTPATLPTGVSCSFTPNPVINSGGATVTLQLFSNNLNANLPMRGNPWNEYPIDGSAIVIAGCIFLIGCKKNHGGEKMMLVASALAFATLMSLAACGTGGSFHSNASSGGHVTGTYTINITASGATPGAADFNQTLTTVPLKVTLQ